MKIMKKKELNIERKKEDKYEEKNNERKVKKNENNESKKEKFRRAGSEIHRIKRKLSLKIKKKEEKENISIFTVFFLNFFIILIKSYIPIIAWFFTFISIQIFFFIFYFS